MLQKKANTVMNTSCKICQATNGIHIYILNTLMQVNTAWRRATRRIMNLEKVVCKKRLNLLVLRGKLDLVHAKYTKDLWKKLVLGGGEGRRRRKTYAFFIYGM